MARKILGKRERAAMRECNQIANIRTSGMIHRDYYELSFRAYVCKNHTGSFAKSKPSHAIYDKCQKAKRTK